MVGELIRWVPIAVMLVPFVRTWRALGAILELMDHPTDVARPWVVRHRGRVMQRGVGQLLVLMGVWMILQGGPGAVNSWTLLLVGGFMWRLPGLFTGMLWEESAADYSESIGPEPRPMDYDHPIGPEDRRRTPDGTLLDWETCFRCGVGIVSLDADDGMSYWIDGGQWPVGQRQTVCGPGAHFPVAYLAPEDRERLEQWLTEE